MLTNRASVALARLCAKHRAFPKGKGRKREYKCGLGFAKQFCGRRIRKTSAHFFASILDFAVQEGAGGMHGEFWARATALSHIGYYITPLY